jgi:hypothetical protein
MSISNASEKRLSTAVGATGASADIVGRVGLSGGFRINHSTGAITSFGDVSAVADSGGQAFAYRVLFPTYNSRIQAINSFNVSGFTPKNPGATETVIANVDGYNYDATLNQWYITVSLLTLTTGVVVGSLANDFVVSVSGVDVTLSPLPL